jgi:hypothetical protein
MKIYLDHGEIGDLPRMVRKKGEFLTTLHGINITYRSGNLEVTPLYQPFARFERHTGQIVITIGYRLPLVLAIFQTRRPFVFVQIIREDKEWT